MQFLKRTLALVLCALMLTALGCRKNDGSSQSEPPVSVPPSVSSLSPGSVPDTTPAPTPSQTSSGSLSVSEAAAILPTYEFGSVPNDRLSWGQGTQFNDQNQPLGSLSYQKKFGEYGAFFIAPAKEGQKTVYLTFDQGYENGYTASILDTLKEKQVPAVFFVVGDYARRNEELVRRMAAEGHTLGNHSWRHKDATALSVDEAKAELTELHDYVLSTYGVTMNLYRPAEGVFSERTLAVADSLGYRTIFWSYAYRDWEVKNQPAPAPTLEKCLARAHDGAIYLLHAVSSTNAAILGDLIDGLREQGYTLEAFSA